MKIEVKEIKKEVNKIEVGSVVERSGEYFLVTFEGGCDVKPELNVGNNYYWRAFPYLLISLSCGIACDAYEDLESISTFYNLINPENVKLVISR